MPRGLIKEPLPLGAAPSPPKNANQGKCLVCLGIDMPLFRMTLCPVFFDHFTKFGMVVPTKDQTVPTTARLFWENVVQLYGYPKLILLNQGQNFDSVILSNLWPISGIRESHTTSYHLQGNGACKRFNHTLLGMLRTLEQGNRER